MMEIIKYFLPDGGAVPDPLILIDFGLPALATSLLTSLVTVSSGVLTKIVSTVPSVFKSSRAIVDNLPIVHYHRG